ncbi:hypothetical protein KP003_10200 [Geomonas nitrogeniifigens]|uniref:Uncharacterized protein n=1 Tax=Geomonas diazotrophica TaxID=2843197 RepID=A0ABX8JMH1_9BACT|nr:hypothetical protein [Geomonas nitrogeniifigens]QWV99560.1 hypothetical protein KP005_09900 [Geomonas nitrogeniifigens]QXE88735.1 hypothetical protein KP003_10200 [Geomonas nitrogeniifigens]
MKRKLLVLMAVSLFAAATPVLADEAPNHGSMHKTGDAQCEKECAMLLKDCNNQVDSIQDRIRKLQVAINEQGATTYTVEELKILKKKLQEANDTLRVLNRH